MELNIIPWIIVDATFAFTEPVAEWQTSYQFPSALSSEQDYRFPSS